MLKKIIKYIFNYLYEDYIYPFNDIDIQLMKMGKDERMDYLKKAYDLERTTFYQKEMEAIVGKFYKDLSTKSLTKLDTAAYRLVLIFIRQFEQRVNYLSKQYQLEENTSSQYKKLD